MANTGAQQTPIYQPAMRVITAITNAYPAEVTTSFDHDYETGEIVRLLVPVEYGMQEVNEMTGIIEVTGSTTFTINIDTSGFNAFVVPGSARQNAEVVPVGGTSFYSATENTLPSGNR